MRITTRLMVDMATGNIIEHDWYEYDGPLELCKGDDTAKQAEIQQAAFNSQLMTIFGKQFDKQSAIFEFLKGKLQPMINHPTGYSPEALAAMRTSATDTIAQQYGNVTKALQNREFTQGGRDLPSGVNDQINASLLTGQAQDTAKAQANITLGNEQLKQVNYWNAIGALSGEQQMLNPLGYANSANEGGNVVGNLSQAYTSSQQNGLLGTILGGVFGAGSAFLGGGAFKAGGMFGGGGGCWIAAAVYEDGWNDTRTHIVREWLNTDFTKTVSGKVVMAAYLTFGKPVAWFVERSQTLKNFFKPLFDYALDKALGLVRVDG